MRASLLHGLMALCLSWPACRGVRPDTCQTRTSGSVAWKKPGALYRDAGGQLYHTSGNRLSRLDPVTGEPTWTRAGYFGEMCPRPDVILASDETGRQVVGISPSNGSALWSISCARQLGCPRPRCPRRGEQHFFLLVDGLVAVHDLKSGVRLWTHRPAGSHRNVTGLGFEQGITLIGSRNQADGQLTLDALELKSGRRRWTLKAPGTSHPFPFLTERGELLVRSWAPSLEVPRYETARIDLASGAVLWKFRGRVLDQEELRFPKRETAGLLATTATALVSLDRDQGQPLWQLSCLALRSVEVLPQEIVASCCTDGTCRIVGRQDRTGAVLWRGSPEASAVAPQVLSDAAGRLYRVSPTELSLLDPKSGKALWSHRYRGSGQDSSRVVMFLDSDPCSVYVGLGDINHKFPIPSVVALDARRGTPRWARHWTRFLASDADRVYLNSGGETGTTPMDPRRPGTGLAVWR